MQYLVPKQIKANGVKENEAVIEESAVRDIVRYYTREAGVRSLNREIARIARKVVMEQSIGRRQGQNQSRESQGKSGIWRKPLW